MRAGKKTIISIFLLLIVAIVACFVYAIGTNDVIINEPDNATWSISTTYTHGFNFSWQDVDEDITSANCTLYMNTSSINLTFDSNSYGSNHVANQTNTVINMSRTFNTTNSIQYWTIRCENLSATPTSWYPATRVMYHDNTVPQVTEGTRSHVTDTWTSDTSLRVEMLPVDTTLLYGDQFTCFIKNNTGALDVVTEDTDNGTAVNITFTMSDGNYSFDIGCRDPANNTNTTNTAYNIFVDTTSPTVTILHPSDNNISSQTWAVLNFTVVEKYLDAIILNWNGTSTWINSTTKCSVLVDNITNKCLYNKTGLTEMTGIVYNVTVNDSTGNIVTSTSQTIKADFRPVGFRNVYNFTISNSSLSFIIAATDYTPTTCQAQILNSDGSNTQNVTGTIGPVGPDGNFNCTGTILPSDIDFEGAFKVRYKIVDGLDNTNYTNKSGVKTDLFSGWNLIAWGDETRSSTSNNITDVCNYIHNCSQASWFNNTDKTFKTFSQSTPTTNGKTVMTKGDPFMIYVALESFVLTNDYYPGDTDSEKYELIYTSGWNTIGILQNANISGLLNVITNNTNVTLSEKNITMATWINASSSTPGYMTCGRSANLCTGGRNPNDINLYKGYGAWALSNANVTINRTAIDGGLK